MSIDTFKAISMFAWKSVSSSVAVGTTVLYTEVLKCFQANNKTFVLVF